MEEPSQEFDRLKVQLGHEGAAHLLTLSQFASLPDARAEKLLNRDSVSDAVAGRLSELRQQAKQGQQFRKRSFLSLPFPVIISFLVI